MEKIFKNDFLSTVISFFAGGLFFITFYFLTEKRTSTNKKTKIDSRSINDKMYDSKFDSIENDWKCNVVFSQDTPVLSLGEEDADRVIKDINNVAFSHMRERLNRSSQYNSYLPQGLYRAHYKLSILLEKLD